MVITTAIKFYMQLVIVVSYHFTFYISTVTNLRNSYLLIMLDYNRTVFICNYSTFSNESLHDHLLCRHTYFVKLLVYYWNSILPADIFKYGHLGSNNVMLVIVLL